MTTEWTIHAATSTITAPLTQRPGRRTGTARIASTGSAEEAARSGTGDVALTAGYWPSIVACRMACEATPHLVSSRL